MAGFTNPRLKLDAVLEDGVRVERFIKEAIVLARAVGQIVEFEYEGVIIRVVGDSQPGDILGAYMGARKGKEPNIAGPYPFTAVDVLESETLGRFILSASDLTYEELERVWAAVPDRLKPPAEEAS